MRSCSKAVAHAICGRFRQRAPLSLEGRIDFRLDTSASSWQGLLVVPGGAPMPPECLVATRLAGAAPRPAYRHASRERPLEGRGEGSLREVWRAGITSGDSSPTPVIPAKAGIQGSRHGARGSWIPAFGGMMGLGPSTEITRAGQGARPTPSRWRCPGRPRPSCRPHGSPHRYAGSRR
jgi:hypothetical protein